MANYPKLSHLLILCTAIFAVCVTSGCKTAVVPPDESLIKSFRDNRLSYTELAKRIMAESNEKFEVDRSGGVKYVAARVPELSEATRRACQQIMSRTFCLAVRRDATVVYFVFFEDLTKEHFRRKALIYDKDGFKAPVWSSKVGDNFNQRFVPIEPQWQLEYKYEELKH